MVIETRTRTEAQANLIGSCVKKALIQANIEKRLVIGLTQIGRFLSQEQGNVPIFCLMAPPKSDDYATHMHEVLLQAFCLENDIYIVQIDSAEKFSRLLDTSRLESCALICANPSGDSDCEGSFLDEDFQMTKNERKLVDYCEDHWNDSEHARIRLPEK